MLRRNATYSQVVYWRIGRWFDGSLPLIFGTWTMSDPNPALNVCVFNSFIMQIAAIIHLNESRQHSMLYHVQDPAEKKTPNVGFCAFLELWG